MPVKRRPPRNEAKTKLKAVRVARGMTQGEVADQAGLSLRTLQALEQGGRNIALTEVGTVLRLCFVLGCRVADILEDEDLVEIAGRV